MRSGAIAAAAAVLLLAAPLAAQTTYDAAVLRDLPTSDNVFSVLETMEPTVVSDRFSEGGLDAGHAARLGGFLASWTQTLFRVDGVTITDPGLTGTPLLLPDLAFFSGVHVSTRAIDSRANAEGLVVDLLPVTAGDRWVRTIEGSVSHFGNGSAAGSDGPPIARLKDWDRATVVASGPLVRERLGALFAGSWTRGSQFNRADVSAADATSGSAFSRLEFTPNARDDIRLLGWLQHSAVPFAQRAAFARPDATTTDTAGHVQAVWAHRAPAPRSFWRVSASYSGRRRNPDVRTGSGVVFERLVDGPLSQLASIARATTQQWSLGAMAGGRREVGLLREWTAGADAVGGRMESRAFFTGLAGEVLNGAAARLWTVMAPAAASSLRHSVNVAPFAAAVIALGPRVSFETGVRFEAATGAAAGAAQDISWNTWLPRARATWSIVDRARVSAFAGYARTTHRLALDYLAIGDPGAPTAEVYSWIYGAAGRPTWPQVAPTLANRGTLVARVGPGTGSGAPLASIDGSLRAPTVDEVVVGLEARPRPGTLFRLSGISRREQRLLALVNVGAPVNASYGAFTANDPGGNVLSPDDDQVLTIYNRLPSAFGGDRYVLMNTEETGTFDGIELTIQVTAKRWTLLGGATAGRAVADAASRGFGPLENDQTVPGERLADPNAATLARGRLFTDRAYTAKFATVYRFPSDIRLGAIARYQDGQPFARVRLFPALNQGIEAVRAFSNGESRFMFVGTLDLRLQKGFALGGRHVDAIVDAFNVLNLANSVEEAVAAAPDVRTSTAIQPPRRFHLGVRVTF